MQAKAAELKAGLLVLAAVAGTLVLLFVAGGEILPWRAYSYWNLRFAPGDLAPRSGDPVEMNGLVVGQVEGVELREELRANESLTPQDRQRLGLGPGEPGRLREIFVHVVIRTPQGERIPEGTHAEILTNIAGVRRLILVPGISPQDIDPEATARRPIPGRAVPGFEGIAAGLDRALGQVSDALEKISRFAGETEEVVREARLLLSDLRQKIAALDTEAMDRQVQAILESVSRAVGGLDERLGKILTNLETAGQNAVEATDTGKKAIQEARVAVTETLGHLKSAAERVDRITAEAEPKVAAALDALAQAGEAVGALAAELSGVGPQVSGILADLGVDAREVLAYLQDAAHNILDASEDIRAHPWKLVNEPDEEEVAFENLRDTATAYGRAVRDLRRLLLTLEQKEGDGKASRSPEREALLAETRLAFRAALERWKDVERRLHALLLGHPGAGSR